MPPIRLQPIIISIPDNNGNGVLVYDDGKLVAILLQLGPETGSDALIGKWTIEAGFDHMGFSLGRLFDNLDEAQEWIAKRVVPTKREVREEE